MKISKLILTTMTIVIGALISFAQTAKAADIGCDVSLAWIDKSSSWGYSGDTQKATVVLKKNKNSNYSGTAVVDFKGGEYKASVSFEVGQVDLKDTWSNVIAVLYKVEAGKNRLLGSVLIPGAYYGAGRIAPEELWIGNNAVLSKVADVPGVFDVTKLNFEELAPKFADGDIVGSQLACAPKP